MIPGGFGERVLTAWERGDGLPLAERALCALQIISEPEQKLPATLFERDAALLGLRIALHGPLVDAVVDCPDCGIGFDVPVDLDALEVLLVAGETVTVEADDYIAVVRPPAADDLRGLDRIDAAAFAAALFRRCVDQASHRGRPVPATELPASVRHAAAQALSACGMESPAADLACGACGATWRAPVDIARIVLRDIDAWVYRQLDDVHRIASAYHWNERDILALSPARRRFYLEAIG